MQNTLYPHKLNNDVLNPFPAKECELQVQSHPRKVFQFHAETSETLIFQTLASPECTWAVSSTWAVRIQAGCPAMSLWQRENPTWAVSSTRAVRIQVVCPAMSLWQIENPTWAVSSTRAVRIQAVCPAMSLWQRESPSPCASHDVTRAGNRLIQSQANTVWNAK